MKPQRIRRILNITWKKAQKCLRSPPAAWRAGFHWYSTLTCYVFISLAGLVGFVARDSLLVGNTESIEDRQQARISGLVGAVGVGALGITACILHRRIRCEIVKEALHLVLATMSHACLLYYYSLFTTEDGLRMSKLNAANFNWRLSCFLFGWRLKFSALFQLVIFATNTYVFQTQSRRLPAASVNQLVFTNLLYCMISLGGSVCHNYILQRCYCCQELAKSEHATLQKALSMTFDSQVWVSTTALCDGSLSMMVRNQDLRFKGLFGQIIKSGNLVELIAPDDLDRVTEAFLCATTSTPMLCAASLGAEPDQTRTPVDLLITKQHTEFVQDNFAAVEGSDSAMYLVSIRLTKQQEKLPRHVEPSATDEGPDCGLPRSLPQVLDVGGRGPPSLCASSDDLTTFTGVVFQDGAQDIETVIALGEQENWLVPDAYLQLSGDVLGSGGFGRVVESTYHGAEVAVKVVARTEPAVMASLLQELRLLRKLRHPNIMAFYGASIDRDASAVRLVFEKAHMGSLDVFVESAFIKLGVKNGKYAALTLPLLLDVALGLSYLHQEAPQIVHGDLKPSNVLLQGSPDGSCKLRAMLSDFGLSRRLTKNAKPMGLSLRWAAPEVAASGPCMPSTSTDVFSFGRLIYFVATALKPFQGMTLSSQLVASGLDSLQWPKSMLADLCAPIAEKCLNTDPTLRPSIVQVRQSLADAVDSVGDEESDDEDEGEGGNPTFVSI